NSRAFDGRQLGGACNRHRGRDRLRKHRGFRFDDDAIGVDQVGIERRQSIERSSALRLGGSVVFRFALACTYVRGLPAVVPLKRVLDGGFTKIGLCPVLRRHAQAANDQAGGG